MSLVRAIKSRREQRVLDLVTGENADVAIATAASAHFQGNETLLNEGKKTFKPLRPITASAAHASPEDLVDYYNFSAGDMSAEKYVGQPAKYALADNVIAFNSIADAAPKVPSEPQPSHEKGDAIHRFVRGMFMQYGLVHRAL